MHFSKIVVIWAAWFLVQVISIPIPADKPLEDLPILTYKHGDIVGVRPHEYEKRPPKEISIHPGVVVDGPNHEGKYSVAMISKKLPHNPPQADIKEFHSNANIYGNVALSPPKQARPKGMKPWKSEKTGEQAIPLDKKGVKMLKNAMVPHAHWREPSPPPESPPATPPPVQPHPPKSKKPRRPSPGADNGNTGRLHHSPPHGSVSQAGPSHYHGPGKHYNNPGRPSAHDPSHYKSSSYSQRRPPSPGPHPHADPSRGPSKNPYGHPAPGQHDYSARPPAHPAPYHDPSGYHAAGPSPFVPLGPHRPVDSLHHNPARQPSHGPPAHGYRPPPPPFPVPHHYGPQEMHPGPYHAPHAYDNTAHPQRYNAKPIRPPSSGVHLAPHYAPQHAPQHPSQHPMGGPAPYGSQHLYHSGPTPPGYHVDTHGQHVVPHGPSWHPSERPIHNTPATHPKPPKGPSRHSTI